MVGYLNAMTDMSGEPVSRTHQYRKVMKPLLERKRRARINRCLDELKDLMTATFQADGENVAKLEKADILELTVRHLQKIQLQKGPGALSASARSEPTYADKFKAGFRQCAAEVTQFLGHVDQNTSTHMLHHLSDCIKQLEQLPGAAAAPPPALAASPASSSASGSPPPAHCYARSLDSQHDDRIDDFDDEDFEDAHHMQMSRAVAAQAAAAHRQQQQRQQQQQRRDNTPPQSPEVDIDGEDEPVWRPW